MVYDHNNVTTFAAVFDRSICGGLTNFTSTRTYTTKSYVFIFNFHEIPMLFR